VNTLSYRTQSATPKSINKEWILIDAKSQPLGRLASQVATIIRGKNKPYFTPHVDCGDNVIIINAEEIRFTGKKWDRKHYISHTGYPGGQRSKTPREVKHTAPIRILEHAVKGMLPKTSLGRRLFHNMFIYPGQQHAHIAQQPKQITLTY
jgi:large subunit ribosomal protein L13